jgi:hypothetical protein
VSRSATWRTVPQAVAPNPSAPASRTGWFTVTERTWWLARSLASAAVGSTAVKPSGLAGRWCRRHPTSFLHRWGGRASGPWPSGAILSYVFLLSFGRRIHSANK